MCEPKYGCPNDLMLIANRLPSLGVASYCEATMMIVSSYHQNLEHES